MTNEQTQTLERLINQKYKFKDGKWRLSSNNRATEISTIISNIYDMLTALQIPINEATDYLKNKEDSYVQLEEGPQYASINEAIGTFIAYAAQEFKWDSTWSRIWRQGAAVQECDLDDIKTYLALWQADHCKQYGIAALEKALKYFVMTRQGAFLDELTAKLTYDPKYTDAGLDVLSELYQALDVEESFDIFKTLMMHWVWLVKRKLIGLPVKWHLWINFNGATGIGKSETIRRLCSVFETLYDQTNVAKLFDDTREVRRFTTKYIINFDEIAINCNSLVDDGSLSADKKNLLKAMLTMDYMNTRIFCSQEMRRSRVTFTCISSANDHLYDVIYDETSMRRFFEFNCNASTANLKSIHKRLNEKVFPNALALWKCVDENLEDGYWDPQSEIGKRIDAIQKSYYPTKTTVNNWMNDAHITVTNKKNDMPLTKGYPLYVKWCEDSGYTKRKNRLSFIDEIKRRFRHLGNQLYFELNSVKVDKKIADLTDEIVMPDPLNLI